jgi:pilus assembly protein CpaF
VIEAAQVMVSRELERIDEAVKQQRDVSENPLTAAPPKSVSSEAPSTSEPFSYGELQPLMEDPAIHRIMINGLDGIYIDRNGQVEPVHYLFEDQAALQSAVARLLAPLRLDPSQFDPVMDTYLPDGTHLNAVFSPIAENGPIITLQKAQRLAFDASTFLQYGCCSEDILQFLGQCVDHRRNIIVTGTAGSGKSACLNMLSQFANPHERVVIIEDVPELAVQLPHAVRLQAGLARVQGVKGLSTQLLLNNTFSMRPDRIILGEFFPSGALDMLMSMNNSSASFLTTFDAHSARDLIYRIELGIVMRKPELPIGIIRSQAAHAVNIIVTMAQFPDGSRKIVEVSEVFGIEEGRVGIQPVFRFLQSGFDEQGLVYGHYEATGYVPSFYRHRERVGETMDTSIFDNTAGMQ